MDSAAFYYGVAPLTLSLNVPTFYRYTVYQKQLFCMWWGGGGFRGSVSTVIYVNCNWVPSRNLHSFLHTARKPNRTYRVHNCRYVLRRTRELCFSGSWQVLSFFKNVMISGACQITKVTTQHLNELVPSFREKLWQASGASAATLSLTRFPWWRGTFSRSWRQLPGTINLSYFKLYTVHFSLRDLTDCMLNSWKIGGAV